jgi:TM2 domain-containing membrane protein YozV
MSESKVITDKVNLWLMSNQDKLPSEKLNILKSELEKTDELMIDNIMSVELKSPLTIFLLAWFVGGWLALDRFLLGNIGVGIARLLTLHGLGIWWLVDTITSMKRTKAYNYKKISNLLGRF